MAAVGIQSLASISFSLVAKLPKNGCFNSKPTLAVTNFSFIASGSALTPLPTQSVACFLFTVVAVIIPPLQRLHTCHTSYGTHQNFLVYSGCSHYSPIAEITYLPYFLWNSSKLFSLEGSNGS